MESMIKLRYAFAMIAHWALDAMTVSREQVMYKGAAPGLLQPPLICCYLEYKAFFTLSLSSAFFPHTFLVFQLCGRPSAGGWRRRRSS